MSQSRKDGRRGGAHRNARNRELWSRRCPKVNMWKPDRVSKTLTHRLERRYSERALRAERQTL